MDFVLASDNNYSQHLAVAIYSVFKLHTEIEKVTIHVLSNQISESNLLLLDTICKKFKNGELRIYEMNNIQDLIGINVNTDHLSIAAYARLFIPKLIPNEVKKALYLDVDVLVNRSLYDLFTLDLGDNYIGAVRSIFDINEKSSDKETNFYINSGVIVFDLDKCRKDKVFEKFISCINGNEGKLKFHDQTVINETLNGSIKELELKYNVMTPVIMLDYNKFLKFYKIKQYYNEKQYQEAKNNPAIIHLTKWIVGRPWEKGSIHPYKSLYLDYLGKIETKNKQLIDGVSRRHYENQFFIAKNFPPIVLKIWNRLVMLFYNN
ncbi:glycosyltransferase family 8 protein [Sedimentibacter sp. B4]|uniref:glycosyltransferase family 8 protein n=1 Tax=Sedimentibacter sp. B4 TaxID=304766 RepID=UPI00030EF5AC|nr:glycosyltransferase family 8 protein [Sedimentibacter sp. B4]